MEIKIRCLFVIFSQKSVPLYSEGKRSYKSKKKVRVNSALKENNPFREIKESNPDPDMKEKELLFQGVDQDADKNQCE